MNLWWEKIRIAYFLKDRGEVEIYRCMHDQNSSNSILKTIIVHFVIYKLHCKKKRYTNIELLGEVYFEKHQKSDG